MIPKSNSGAFKYHLIKNSSLNNLVNSRLHYSVIQLRIYNVYLSTSMYFKIISPLRSINHPAYTILKGISINVPIKV